MAETGSSLTPEQQEGFNKYHAANNAEGPEEPVAPSKSAENINTKFFNAAQKRQRKLNVAVYGNINFKKANAKNKMIINPLKNGTAKSPSRKAAKLNTTVNKKRRLSLQGYRATTTKNNKKNLQKVDERIQLLQSEVEAADAKVAEKEAEYAAQEKERAALAADRKEKALAKIQTYEKQIEAGLNDRAILKAQKAYEFSMRKTNSSESTRVAKEGSLAKLNKLKEEVLEPFKNDLAAAKAELAAAEEAPPKDMDREASLEVEAIKAMLAQARKDKNKTEIDRLQTSLTKAKAKESDTLTGARAAAAAVRKRLDFARARSGMISKNINAAKNAKKANAAKNKEKEEKYYTTATVTSENIGSSILGEDEQELEKKKEVEAAHDMVKNLSEEELKEKISKSKSKLDELDQDVKSATTDYIKADKASSKEAKEFLARARRILEKARAEHAVFVKGFEHIEDVKKQTLDTAKMAIEELEKTGKDLDDKDAEKAIESLINKFTDKETSLGTFRKALEDVQRKVVDAVPAAAAAAAAGGGRTQSGGGMGALLRRLLRVAAPSKDPPPAAAPPPAAPPPAAALVTNRTKLEEAESKAQKASEAREVASTAWLAARTKADDAKTENAWKALQTANAADEAARSALAKAKKAVTEEEDEYRITELPDKGDEVLYIQIKGVTGKTRVLGLITGIVTQLEFESVDSTHFKKYNDLEERINRRADKVDLNERELMRNKLYKTLLTTNIITRGVEPKTGDVYEKKKKLFIDVTNALMLFNGATPDTKYSRYVVKRGQSIEEAFRNAIRSTEKEEDLKIMEQLLEFSTVSVDTTLKKLIAEQRERFGKTAAELASQDASRAAIEKAEKEAADALEDEQRQERERETAAKVKQLELAARHARERTAAAAAAAATAAAQQAEEIKKKVQTYLTTLRKQGEKLMGSINAYDTMLKNKNATPIINIDQIINEVKELYTKYNTIYTNTVDDYTTYTLGKDVDDEQKNIFTLLVSIYEEQLKKLNALVDTFTLYKETEADAAAADAAAADAAAAAAAAALLPDPLPAPPVIAPPAAPKPVKLPDPLPAPPVIAPPAAPKLAKLPDPLPAPPDVKTTLIKRFKDSISSFRNPFRRKFNPPIKKLKPTTGTTLPTPLPEPPKVDGDNEEDDELATTVANYKEKADEGLAFAQHAYAEMLENGKFVDTDEKGAAAYYKLAAEQGYVPSLFKFGYMLEYGKGGLTPDIPRAIQYYADAAKRRNEGLDEESKLLTKAAAESAIERLQFIASTYGLGNPEKLKAGKAAAEELAKLQIKTAKEVAAIQSDSAKKAAKPKYASVKLGHIDPRSLPTRITICGETVELGKKTLVKKGGARGRAVFDLSPEMLAEEKEVVPFENILLADGFETLYLGWLDAKDPKRAERVSAMKVLFRLVFSDKVIDKNTNKIYDKLQKMYVKARGAENTYTGWRPQDKIPCNGSELWTDFNKSIEYRMKKIEEDIRNIKLLTAAEPGKYTLYQQAKADQYDELDRLHESLKETTGCYDYDNEEGHIPVAAVDPDTARMLRIIKELIDKKPAAGEAELAAFEADLKADGHEAKSKQELWKELTELIRLLSAGDEEFAKAVFAGNAPGKTRADTLKEIAAMKARLAECEKELPLVNEMLDALENISDPGSVEALLAAIDKYIKDKKPSGQLVALATKLQAVLKRVKPEDPAQAAELARVKAALADCERVGVETGAARAAAEKARNAAVSAAAGATAAARAAEEKAAAAVAAVAAAVAEKDAAVAARAAAEAAVAAAVAEKEKAVAAVAAAEAARVAAEERAKAADEARAGAAAEAAGAEAARAAAAAAPGADAGAAAAAAEAARTAAEAATKDAAAARAERDARAVELAAAEAAKAAAEAAGAAALERAAAAEAAQAEAVRGQVAAEAARAAAVAAQEAAVRDKDNALAARAAAEAARDAAVAAQAAAEAARAEAVREKDAAVAAQAANVAAAEGRVAAAEAAAAQAAAGLGGSAASAEAARVAAAEELAAAQAEAAAARAEQQETVDEANRLIELADTTADAKIQEAKAAADARVIQAEASAAAAQERRTALERSIAEQISALDISSTKRATDAAEEKSREIKRIKAAENAKVQAAKADADAARAEVVRVTEEAETLRSRVEPAEAAKAALQVENSRLQAEVAVLRSQLAQKDSAAGRAAGHAGAALAAAKARIAELEQYTRGLGEEDGAADADADAGVPANAWVDAAAAPAAVAPSPESLLKPCDPLKIENVPDTSYKGTGVGKSLFNDIYKTPRMRPQTQEEAFAKLNSDQQQEYTSCRIKKFYDLSKYIEQYINSTNPKDTSSTSPQIKEYYELRAKTRAEYEKVTGISILIAQHGGARSAKIPAETILLLIALSCPDETSKSLLEKSSTVINGVGSCKTSLEVLRSLLDLTDTLPEVDEEVLEFREAKGVDPASVAKLATAYNAQFTPEEKAAVESMFGKKTVYARPPAEYSSLLGSSPYALNSRSGSVLKGVDDMDEDPTLNEEELDAIAGAGGLSEGALTLLYLTALHECGR